MRSMLGFDFFSLFSCLQFQIVLPEVYGSLSIVWNSVHRVLLLIDRRLPLSLCGGCHRRFENNPRVSSSREVLDRCRPCGVCRAAVERRGGLFLPDEVLLSRSKLTFVDR